MSEIKKNIETCRGEDVLAEVSAAPSNPHFGSLVNEALDPLKQQAAAQEGWDGYSEVIEQHKPYTFASAIIQMKSNLLLLLRALWQFPFGSGTRSLSDDASLRSLADMWSHYITRLQGNETYGTPSRLSSLTDLPSAPLLVSDRKISGVPDAADGISLENLLGSDAATEITQIVDDNHGWTWKRCNIQTIRSLFPNLTKLVFNNKTLSGDMYYYDHGGSQVVNDTIFKDIEFAEMETVNGGFNLYTPNAELKAPKLTTMVVHGLGAAGPTAKVIDFPSLRSVSGHNRWWQSSSDSFSFMKKIVLGSINNFSIGRWFWDDAEHCPNLLHFEFGADGLGGLSVSMNLAWWNPTSAWSDEDKQALFLSNFRTYIALRLATFDSNGPTLTLSQAVYDAIKDESHLFVFDEGTMTIYAYLTNIKHWTVTK